ncbi:nucleotide exchange factor GrpE [[Eubacterium] cellulosolvens]
MVQRKKTDSKKQTQNKRSVPEHKPTLDSPSSAEQDEQFIQFTSVQKGEFKLPTKSQLAKYKIPETDLAISERSMNLIAKLPGASPNDLILWLNEDTVQILSNGKQNAYFTEIKLPDKIIPQATVAKFENGILNLYITKLTQPTVPWDGLAELERLRSELVESKDKLSQLQKQYYAIQQDYQNLLVKSKKQVEEKIDAFKILVLEKILRNIDNFEMALDSISKSKDKNKNSEQLIVGVNLILNELRSILIEEGVTEIGGIGLILDPLQHEVLDCEESNTYPENTILEVYQKGYKYKNRVIRPSKVRVAVQLKPKKKGKSKKKSG